MDELERDQRNPGVRTRLGEAQGTAAPVEHMQAWRAWAGCGDGAQVHLIIDPPAQRVWLLPAENTYPMGRSER
jgi:hypothetical protein